MLEPFKQINKTGGFMMIGTTRAEIDELNQINLIEYLLKTDRNNYNIRKGGEITPKHKDNIVIYKNHSYDFGTTVKAYKDVIGTLRFLYDYDFMQTVNKLRDYKNNTQSTGTNQADYEEQIPNYNLF